MDVILDSNTYLEDIRMESIRFKNLFDYLKRVRASLVLPRVIREETIATYIHQLETETKRAQKAVDDLNRLNLDPSHKSRLSAPMPKYAARDLRKGFRQPSDRCYAWMLPPGPQGPQRSTQGRFVGIED